MRVSLGILIVAIATTLAGAVVSRATSRLAVAADGDAVDSDAERVRHFEERIAPLLMRRCVECHGPSARKGRLDLSRKDAAFAGGESGEVLVAGRPDESSLWQYVESDEMPKGRAPLEPEEKAALRRWIEAGAVWSTETLVSRDRGDAVERLRRLTVPEYVETVRVAVGVDIGADARRLLPPDLRADGFSNTAYNLTVDFGHVEAYARLARIVAERADRPKFVQEVVEAETLAEAKKRWKAFAAVASDPANDDATRGDDFPALRGVVASIGKRLLRGPLDDSEIAAYLRIVGAVAAEGGELDEAVGYVVEAMLQSPRFLYRVERVAGDGDPRELDDYALASRLSYTLWGGPPDNELMRLADAGQLSDDERFDQQVRRMLQDPRAIERSSRFVAEWLNLDGLSNLRPDADRFPGWRPELADDMREETLAYFRHVAWDSNRPLSDLLNAQVTFVTPRLADHYNLPAAAGGRGRYANVAKIDGLIALYRFDEGSGDAVRDVSGAGTPLELTIADPSAVEWGPLGLTIKSPTILAGDPPKRLVEALRESRELTLEAWITPADAKQSGPARILTLSSGTSQRNVTFGQDGDKFDVRLRSKMGGDANGLPSLSSPAGSAASRPTHVVYVRDRKGKASLFIDGERQATRDVAGDFSNWNDEYRFALANETSSDRPWLGTLHRVAIYDRALESSEIAQLAASAPASNEPMRIDLTDVPERGGLLTQGSVLTVGGDDASMVTRGLFVMRDLLDDEIGDPPPCVDTTPVPAKPGMTQRSIALGRLANASCTGCHSRFEPFAFGLERFDGVGTYRERDEFENELRDDGEIVLPGVESPVAYESSSELMDVLAKSERLRETLTRKVAQFALGRPLDSADSETLKAVHAAAQADGGTYASTVAAIVKSDLVRKRRAPPSAP